MSINFPHVFGKFLVILPDKALSRIGNRVFPRKVEELPVAGRCEIAFVFGSSEDHAREERALELWRNRRIYNILVTGGHGPFTPAGVKTEADFAHDFLRERGVPERNILVENRSRNTLENVRFGLELLRRYDYGKGTSFVVISNDYHLPRAVGLLWTALGESFPSIYWSGVKNDKISRETWRDSPEGRFWVVKEDLRVFVYKLTGKIKYGIMRPQFR